jgi:predicted metal-dependent peptidase
MANKLKFTTAKELEDKLKDFDGWLWQNNYPYRTVTRLAEYLDTTRQTLINYQDEIQDGIDEEEAKKIRHVLSRAKLSIEADEHDRLYDKNTARGAEFSLKNNHGWSDRQDLNLGGGTGVKIEIDSTLKDYTK